MNSNTLKPIINSNKEARKPGFNRQGAKTAKGETGKTITIFNREIYEMREI